MATERIIKNVVQWENDAQSLQKQIADTNRAGDAVVMQAKRAADASKTAREAASAYNAVLGEIGATTSANLLLLEQRMQNSARAMENRRKAASAAAAEQERLERAYTSASVADGFLRDLERIQAVEAESLRTNTQITEEFKKQSSYLQQRLSNAERFRETGFTAGLRGDLLGGLTGGSAGGGGGGRGGETAGRFIQRASRNLFNLPDVGASTTVARLGILGGGVADKLGLSITQIGAASAVAAPLLIAGAVAWDRVTQAAEAGKRRLEAAQEANRRYYDAVASETTAGVQARLEQLRRERDAQQASLDNQRSTLESNFQALQSRIGGTVTFAGDALARIFDNQVGIGQLREGVQETEKQLNTTTDEITRLEQGLANGAFAANDLRETEAQLAEARKNAQLANADFALEVSRLTEAERISRAARIQEDARLLQQEIDSGNAQGEAADELRARIDVLNGQYLELTTTSETYADQLARQLALEEERQRIAEANELLQQERIAAELREFDQRREAENLTAEQRRERIREAQAEQAAISAQLAAGRLSQGAADELRQRFQDLGAEIGMLAGITETYADRLAQEQRIKEFATQATEDYFAALDEEAKAREALAEAQRKEADAAAEHVLNVLMLQQEVRDKEAELYAKAEDETVERETKARADRIKQEAAYYKELQDIQRRANATMANAVAARDVMAFVLAKQQRDEDIRKAKEDNDERLKQVDENLKEQKDAIAKRLQEQLDAQRRAAEKALRTENERYQREAQILAQATAQAQQQLVTAQTTSNMLLQNYYTQALMYTQTFVSAASAEYARLLSLASGSSGGSTGNSSQWSGSSFPLEPYSGQVVINDTGTWVWNGHGWQPGYGVPQYATGLDYAQTRHLAIIDPGEGVLTAAENRDRRQGKAEGGVSFSPTFNLAMVDENEMVRVTTNTLREYIRAAKAGKKGRSP